MTAPKPRRHKGLRYTCHLELAADVYARLLVIADADGAPVNHTVAAILREHLHLTSDLTLEDARLILRACTGWMAAEETIDAGTIEQVERLTDKLERIFPVLVPDPLPQQGAPDPGALAPVREDQGGNGKPPWSTLLGIHP